jgi:glycosyltransferase involved in cell wall biosynthesis
MRQSYCGLILSKIEGVCRASSEYLLTGLPVVSTPSKGGRDVWYDKDNSLIVDPDECQVAEAVAEFMARPRDPSSIRDRYLNLAKEFRHRFRDEVLAPLLKQHKIDISAQDVMQTHNFPWWGKWGKELVLPLL